MAESVSTVSGNDSAGADVSVVSQTELATKPSAAAAAGGASKSSTFSSMAELKEKAPEVHKGMMESIALNMLGALRRSQARIHQLNKSAQRG